MSTTSPEFHRRSAKRLAYWLTAVFAGALFFLLPKTEHALSLNITPVQAALRRPTTMLLPSAHGFWHTEGNQILDSRNLPVRISGMNWSGFETRQAVPGGLSTQDYRAILRTIQRSGYNAVRIPLSNEMIETPFVPEKVAFSNDKGAINTDLRGLNSLEVLDRIVSYSGEIGLKIILDDHRSEAGSSAEESGLWYTPQFPESAWIQDWTAMARRYENNSAVVGMDLRNEPHNADKGGSCWDCGGNNDWHRAAQRAGNAILAVNPRLLIFVEGVDSYAGDAYWWGGNLEGVLRSPVRLSVPNRLVYSAHEYGPSEYAQPWFNRSTSSSLLASIWRRHWGFISEAGIAPVWIGEFGTSNNSAEIQSSAPGSEGQWFSSLIGYLYAHPAVGWTYWGVNGEDRYGLLRADYSAPANQLKAEALLSVAEGSPAQMPQQGPATYQRTLAEPSIHMPAHGQSGISASETDQRTDLQPYQNQLPPPIGDGPVRDLSPSTRKANARARLTGASGPDLSVNEAIASSIHDAVTSANRSLTSGSEFASR